MPETYRRGISDQKKGDASAHNINEPFVRPARSLSASRSQTPSIYRGRSRNVW